MPDPEVLSPEEGQQIPLSQSALSAIEEGDRRSMIAAAKANPRNITVFMKELLELCTISEAVAQEMTYSLPRAGGQIIGPSVRFAETVVYCYRNLRAGSEVVDVGDKQLTAEGRVYDAERNNGIAVRVNRNISGKYGRFNQDMIGVTGVAAGSIAYRNAVLRYVPKAFWNDIWEQSKQAAVGKVETHGKKRDEALKHFNQMGVTDVQVFNALNVAGRDDIKTDEIVAMRSWARELKEGKRTVEDIFGSPLDSQIDKAMTALGWNGTKQRLSRENFAGNREGHLAHLKKEAEQAGIKLDGDEQPAKQAAPAKEVEPQQEKAAEEPKKEDKPPVAESLPELQQQRAKAAYDQSAEDAKPAQQQKAGRKTDFGSF